MGPKRAKSKQKDQPTLPLSQESPRPVRSLYTSQQPSSDEGTIVEEENTVHSLRASVESLFTRIVRDVQQVFDELKRIEEEFDKTVNVLEKRIDDLTENYKLSCEKIKDLEVREKLHNDRYKSLEQRIEQIVEINRQHTDALNVQERFSRRNNIRIVGFPYSESENPIEVAKSILKKAGIDNPSIERAHRDGRINTTRSRHILVKLSFYQEKIITLKQQRLKLSNESFFITDDLTKPDLLEKRKWSEQVSQLYQSGTKLRFIAGKWRDSTGKPYNFGPVTTS